MALKLEPRDDVWVGIGLHAPHDEWTWLDGSPLDYENWAIDGQTYECTGAVDCIVGIEMKHQDRAVGFGQWTGRNVLDVPLDVLCTIPSAY